MTKEHQAKKCSKSVIPENSKFSNEETFNSSKTASPIQPTTKGLDLISEQSETSSKSTTNGGTTLNDNQILQPISELKEQVNV